MPIVVFLFLSSPISSRCEALRDTPHPTHFSVSDALALIETVQPRRAVLTNLHTDLDYAALAARLPDGVVPAYDGMNLSLDA